MPRWKRKFSDFVALVGIKAIDETISIMRKKNKERTCEDVRKALLLNGVNLTDSQIAIVLDWFKQNGLVSSKIVCGYMAYKWEGWS